MSTVRSRRAGLHRARFADEKTHELRFRLRVVQPSWSGGCATTRPSWKPRASLCMGTCERGEAMEPSR